tara:strand:+ start:2151 stop:6644 length:4494 start_codon:yes stop_codon:yes gene_type:complete
MQKQISALVLVILLSSTFPLTTQVEVESPESENNLLPEHTRIEISPDPNSIRDLGAPKVVDGSEGHRGPWADSSIGTFTSEGLVLRETIPEILREPRPDLLMVIISPETGLWDARIGILEAAEVAVRTTIPPSGFLLQGSSKELDTVKGLPFLTSSHSVPLALIIDDLLWNLQTTSDVEMIGWKDSDLVRLDSPGLGLGGSLGNTASQYLSGTWSPVQGIHFGNAHPSSVYELAMKPEVAFLSPIPLLITSNNLARSHSGVGSVEDYFFTGLNGSDQIVAVADSGIDHDHGDFGGRIVQRIDVANDGSTSDPSDGHGTHVACTVLGSGFRTSTYAGVAPEAELYMQAMEDQDTGALSSPGIYSLLNSAYSSGGARIHTNSWGGWNSGGDYTTQSEDADDRTSTWDQYWTYDGMTVLFAAGNERDDGISPPGTAKNVITVGAHVNRYSATAEDEMYYWSSRGPTDDGRIKPDIVAAGDYVRSCKAQEASDAPDNLNDQWYVEYSGTSMATPVAAGASALVREYLMEIAQRPDPQGALVKAMLILGAEDMGTRDIPNNDEGWGRLNLVNTLLPDSEFGDVGIFVDDRTRLSSGQEASYNFDVTRSGEPLKIVLAWSDYPGSTFSGTQLRNDLDLEVTSPTGAVTYLGNDFTNGKSTTGGSKDSKNNVEVVLIDSAQTGIWNVKVKDSAHGGSRTYQPFSIAVRGVNVNDLTPDPAIVPGSFEISTPIPQVGEQTTFSLSVINQGSGSFAEVFVNAHVNGDLVETKSIGMSPGEQVTLEWLWTPEVSDKGDSEIRIEIDPNDQLEELYEDNNLLIESIEVSAPGIQASSESPWLTLQDASDTTTRWEIVMTNLGLFDTNASIEASSPTRTIDGATFDWFKTFDKYYVELGPAASTTVNLTLVHPAPPDPGTYSMVITANDEDFDVESQLEIFFDVPVLAKPEISLPSEMIQVDSFDLTNTSVEVYNKGNGAQTYDIEISPPAGWGVGLLELGPFQGSSQGSTGTLVKDGSITARITITPPGVMLEAGTTFYAQFMVKSRVSSEVWSYDLPLVIDPIDSVEFIPDSGGNETGVPADSLHEMSIQIYNQGNRELVLTPIARSLPGGWSIQGGLDKVTIPRGSSIAWSFSIQGNGLAASGPVEIRFLVEGGTFFDWNTNLEAVSGAIASVSFHEVVLINGSNFESSSTPLGLGAHPVGQAFDLGWELDNDGTSNWEPSVSMELPSEDWESTCSVNPSMIGPGESAMVWCSITIPLSESAGSEPEVTMVLSGDGVEVRESLSLLVETISEVEWTLENFDEAHEGFSTTLYLELRNNGNTPISNRLVADGPDGWGIRILDGILVTLQPGEARSVQVEFTPNSGSDGVVTVMLADAEDVTGKTKSVEIDVIADPVGEGPGLFTYFLFFLLLLLIAAVSAAVAFSKSGGDISSLLPSSFPVERGSPEGPDPFPKAAETQSMPPSNLQQSETENPHQTLQTFSDHPGWLWDPSEEEWVPDPEYDHGEQ